MDLEKPKLSYSFKYSERLHSQKDFQQLLKAGRRLVHPALLIYTAANKLPDGRVTRRMGLITSRKLGIAAKRNRLKRRLREIFRLHKHFIKPGTDIIFMPKTNASDMNYKQLETIVLTLLKKAGVLIN